MVLNALIAGLLILIPECRKKNRESIPFFHGVANILPARPASSNTVPNAQEPMNPGIAPPLYRIISTLPVT
jgi:hypothetical protein